MEMTACCAPTAPELPRKATMVTYEQARAKALAEMEQHVYTVPPEDQHNFEIIYQGVVEALARMVRPLSALTMGTAFYGERDPIIMSVMLALIHDGVTACIWDRALGHGKFAAELIIYSR